MTLTPWNRINMRLLTPPRLYVLGLVMAFASLMVGVAPGCGQTGIVTCDPVEDPNRIGPDGLPDPCCEFSPGPCVCAPGYGDCKDAGADADAGPPPMDAAADADTTDADTTDAGTDAGTDAEACLGTCIPPAAFGWSGPVLLWKGAVGETVACPAVAPEVGYVGFADLLDVGSASCGACGCALAPESHCGPPQNITASTAKCSETGGSPLPFDPPPAWDGACSSFDAILSGAQSLSSGPLTLDESCVATAAVPDVPTTPAGFGSSVVVCLEKPAPGCDAMHICAPADPAFRSCLYQQEDVATCPASYPVRISAADGLSDERACAPCGCTVEAGSCSAILTVYDDAACAANAFLFSRKIDTTPPPCDGVAAPGTLGSKTLGKPDYEPGTCSPSGGQPAGGVVATGVATFCCLP